MKRDRPRARGAGSAIGLLLPLWLCSAGCVVNPVPTPFEQDDNAQTATIGGGGNNKASADAGARWQEPTSPGDRDEASADGANAGFAGLAQAGAQDFGLFRSILEAGEVPAPGTLDDVGFFAEHKIDQPPPDCGKQVCGHAQLGEMGNMLTSSPLTLLQIGLNTPLQSAQLKRPPLHAVLALDRSQSMAGAALDHVKVGITLMVGELRPGDRVSVVAFSDQAEVLLEAHAIGGEDGGKQAVLNSLGGLQAGGKTNLYSGLFSAFAVAAAHQASGAESRVILLSDGAATAGLLQPGKLVSLAAGWAKKGIGITTIGLGKAADLSTLRDLAEVGAGHFYFLDKPAAVEEVFVEEARTFFVPLALDVRIEVEIGDGWLVGGAYGTHGWKGHASGGRIDLPGLFLAGRSDASDPLPGPAGTGRRGGGGAMLLALMPLPNVVDSGSWVAKLKLHWRHPLTGESHQQDLVVDKGWISPTAPLEGWFSSAAVEKGFVMLNIFAGFRLATELASDADAGAATGVLQALRQSVVKWLADPSHAAPDPDIGDDLKYIDLFLTNLSKFGHQTPVSEPPEPWPIN